MTEEDKQYKIFGRKKGKKLTNLQKENLEKYLNDFSVFQTHNDSIKNLRKFNPNELFHSFQDIRLEIGFGMGDFLFNEALVHPNVGFIGCETFENGVSSLLSKIIKFKVKNIRIHFGNCVELIKNFTYLTLSEIYILFTDPWPKTKHKKRRFFNETNAYYLCSLLRKNGTIKVVTDSEDYAIQILRIMDKKKNFEFIKSNFFQSERKTTENFNTKYEKKALDFGRNTNYLIFKKNYE